MPAPSVTSFIEFNEINDGKRSSAEEFNNELKRFPRNGLLRLCGIVNDLTANWSRKHDAVAQAKLIRTFFPPRIADWAIGTGRPMFHRHQLLFTAQEALKYCTIPEGVIDKPYADGIGTVLLMANEQLAAPIPEIADPLERVAAIISGFIPVIEANRIHSYLSLMARSILMFTRFIEPLRGKPNFFDARALFQEAAGIPLETYFALLFGAMSRFPNTTKLREEGNFGEFIIPSSWFSTTKVSTDHVERFFADIAATPDELSAVIIDKKPQPSDFLAFRSKPLVRDPAVGGFYPMDFTYLAEKFYTGPFWRVHNSLPNEQRPNFHNFWGEVFEDYMNWLLREFCISDVNRFYEDPRYESNLDDQVCDAVIICDRDAVLLEYKGSTFTSISKYGPTIDEIKAELEAKLVQTKGVGQLATAVERLCRYDKPDRIQGIDFSGISTVFPLIVIRDEIGSGFGMNAYLNSRFQELKPQKTWRSVTPMFSLSADDLEKLTPYLADVPLTRALSARYRRDKALLSPFWMVDNSVIDPKGERHPQFIKMALQIIREMSARTLGLSPEPNSTVSAGASSAGQS